MFLTAVVLHCNLWIMMSAVYKPENVCSFIKVILLHYVNWGSCSDNCMVFGEAAVS